MTVSPGTGLLDGQYVLVTWSGFEPDADIYLWECGQGAQWTVDCVTPSQMFYDNIGYTDDYPLSDDSGGGSLWIPVGAASVPTTADFQCNAAHPCEIAVTQNPLKGKKKDPKPEQLSATAPLSFAATPDVLPLGASSPLLAPASSRRSWHCSRGRPRSATHRTPLWPSTRRAARPVDCLASPRDRRNTPRPGYR